MAWATPCGMGPSPCTSPSSTSTCPLAGVPAGDPPLRLPLWHARVAASVGGGRGPPPYTFPPSPRSCRQDASGQPFSCTSLSAAGAAAGMRAGRRPSRMHLPIQHISIPRRRATRQWGKFCPHAFLLIPPTDATLAPTGTLSADLEHLPFQRAHALDGKGGRGDPGLASTPAALLRSRWRRCQPGALSQHLPLQHAWAAAGVSAGWGPSPCASRSSTMASLTAKCGRDLLPNVQKMANDYQGATGS